MGMFGCFLILAGCVFLVVAILLLLKKDDDYIFPSIIGLTFTGIGIILLCTTVYWIIPEINYTSENYQHVIKHETKTLELEKISHEWYENRCKITVFIDFKASIFFDKDREWYVPYNCSKLKQEDKNRISETMHNFKISEGME